MSSDPGRPLPRVERDPEDDHPLFFHACTGVHADWENFGGKLPLGPDGWQWQADGSLSPSIECLECGCHGFWRGEQGWVSA
jgi:hypothetical protein